MKNKKEIKPEKEIAKQIRQAKKLKKKVASTLDWMDIEDIADDSIVLKAGKKLEYIKGIKVMPHQIFLDTEAEQARIVERLRVAHNKIICPIYWGFVFTPVNLDQYQAELLRRMNLETDALILGMLQDDYDKAAAFMKSYRELEFFLMVKGKTAEEIDKNLGSLYTEFYRAGMSPRVLNSSDFKNYLAYVFENPLINDYYFSEGIFAPLNESKETIEAIQKNEK